MKHSEYWKNRILVLEDMEYQKTVEYYKNLQNQFRMAQNDIQLDIEHWYERLADNNDISLAAARKLLKKNELEEFHWTVENYIKAGKENAINHKWVKQLENASAKYHISYLETMKLQVQQHCELLSVQYENGVTDFLHKQYAERFYRTAYEYQGSLGIYTNLAKLDTRTIDKVVKYPWCADGKNFSDRIWTNKEKLVRELNTELTQCLIRGENPKKAGERLAKTMRVSEAQAQTLLLTEAAAVKSKSTYDSYKKLGVKKYIIIATLDSKTSEICQEMDGKVFDMKVYEIGATAPPFHPRCRTDYAAYDEDVLDIEVGTRVARDEDGKTIYVPADMTYKEWYNEYVANSPESSKIELSKEEEGSVLSYLSSESYKINDKLRNKAELSKIDKKMIANLDNALDKLPIYVGNLIRVLDFSDFPDTEKMTNDFVAQFDVNSTVAFSEYISASKLEGYGESPQVKIYIQDSKKGHDLNSFETREYEVLYERNSEFKVLSKQKVEGIYYILLEEL